MSNPASDVITGTVTNPDTGTNTDTSTISTPGSAPAVLYDLREAGFSYAGCKPSLTKVNLRITRGEHLALLGANGAGKSTLLQLLGGLLFSTEGMVVFDGQSLTHDRVDHDAAFRRMFRTRVGFLFQNSDAQLFCPTVLEEVAFGPLQILDRKAAMDQTREAMALLDVERLADEAPYALSGGEKRRVALAAVLAMRPDVLLLDEPSANLDPKTCERLYEVLDSYAQDDSKTVVIATHDLDSAAALADMCAVVTPGHDILMHADADTVLSDREMLRQVNLIGHDVEPRARRKARG